MLHHTSSSNLLPHANHPLLNITTAESLRELAVVFGPSLLTNKLDLALRSNSKLSDSDLHRSRFKALVLSAGGYPHSSNYRD